MTCPVCNRDDNAYLRRNRPDCTDGRHVPDPRIAARLASGEFTRRADGKLVCATCGGNCGQCGNTGVLGNVPADMQALVNSLTAPEHIRAERRRSRTIIALLALILAVLLCTV